MIMLKSIDDNIEIIISWGEIMKKKSLLLLIFIFLVLKISAQNTDQYDYAKGIERKNKRVS